MGIKQRKEREKEEMKKFILDVAMKLFLKDGYENVSIRKIAEKIEYSPGTIYLYYKSKEEIFFELHSLAFDKFYKCQQTINHITNAFEKLIQHAKVYLEFAFDNPEYYELMFILKEPGNQIVKEKSWDAGMRTFQCLKDNIDECFKQGYIKHGDVLSVSLTCWSYVHGIASLYLRDRFAMIPKEFLYSMLNNSLDYMFNTMNDKSEKFKNYNILN